VRQEREALAGPVEVDEGYVGGREEGVSGRHVEMKSVVAVAVEVKDKSAGRLRLAKVRDAGGDTLNAFVAQNVVKDSLVKTDGSPSYSGLREIGYRHRRRVIEDITRASRLFPHVHRGLSLLKRWLLAHKERFAKTVPARWRGRAVDCPCSGSLAVTCSNSVSA